MAVIYVDITATGANDGTSWTNAYTDLQSALAVAGSSDEIWVAQGTYLPGGSRTSTFNMPSTEMYGGFNGTETLRGQRDAGVNQTILSGDILGNDSGFTNNAENCYNVVTANGVECVVDGFFITGGNANGGSNIQQRGGGLRAQGGAIVEVDTCVFEYNSALEFGGGLYATDDSTDVTVNDCTFQLNRCDGSGGGLAARGAQVTLDIDGCYFFGNESFGGHGGGGIHVDDILTCEIHGSSTFISNTAAMGGGGGVGLERCNAIVYASYFQFNDADHTASTDGGGLRCSRCDSVEVHGLIFDRNEAYQGGGLYIGSASMVYSSVYNMDFYDNTAFSFGAGGGFRMQNVNTAPGDPGIEIDNLYFEGNITDVNGGGAYFDAIGAIIITDTQFRHNESENGGHGLRLFDIPACTLENVYFYDNTDRFVGAYNDGGALHCRSIPDLSITGCRFRENSAGTGLQARGGGACIENCEGFIEDTIFMGNEAGAIGANTGGTLYIDDSLLIISETRFVENITGGIVIIDSVVGMSDMYFGENGNNVYPSLFIAENTGATSVGINRAVFSSMVSGLAGTGKGIQVSSATVFTAENVVVAGNALSVDESVQIGFSVLNTTLSNWVVRENAGPLKFFSPNPTRLYNMVFEDNIGYDLYMNLSLPLNHVDMGYSDNHNVSILNADRINFVGGMLDVDPKFETDQSVTIDSISYSASTGVTTLSLSGFSPADDHLFDGWFIQDAATATWFYIKSQVGTTLEVWGDFTRTISGATPVAATLHSVKIRYGSPLIDAGHGDYAPTVDIWGRARTRISSLPLTGVGTPPYSDIGVTEYISPWDTPLVTPPVLDGGFGYISRITGVIISPPTLTDGLIPIKLDSVGGNGEYLTLQATAAQTPLVSDATIGFRVIFREASSMDFVYYDVGWKSGFDLTGGDAVYSEAFELPKGIDLRRKWMYAIAFPTGDFGAVNYAPPIRMNGSGFARLSGYRPEVYPSGTERRRVVDPFGTGIIVTPGNTTG